MDTRETSSEVALAKAALSGHDRPSSVLVGGLGLGFTAHAVLADHRVERVIVAEIEDVLVGWFHDGTVPHGSRLLADSRLHVVAADVAELVAEAAPGSFDLVLLDVDNGPDFLVLDDNAVLYETPFLATVRTALREGGRVAIWSSTRSDALERSLRSAFGASGCEELAVELQGRDESYWLYTATKTS
jgi:spermidine synthase